MDRWSDLITAHLSAGLLLSSSSSTGKVRLVCGWRRNGFAHGSRGTNCSNRLTFPKRSVAFVRSVQQTVLSRVLFLLF
jgi:hypothetical protein